MTYNQVSNTPTNQEEESFLIDIIFFMKRSWKTIAITCMFSVFAAIIYLSFAPKQFRAVALIQMAQYKNPTDKLIMQGINVEEPNALIARMSLPNFYSSLIQSDCGSSEDNNWAESIKLRQPKGMPSVVEMKVTGKSAEAAQQCALEIFNFLKKSQNTILSPYIETLKRLLKYNQDELSDVKKILLKLDNDNSRMSALYLNAREEMLALTKEINALRFIIEDSVNSQTQLLNPIYVSDTPVFPKKDIVLALGLLGGIVLGLLVAFLRQLALNVKKLQTDNSQS